MKTLARLTAIMLIFVGLLTALGGAYFVSRGLMQTEPFMPGLFGGRPGRGHPVSRAAAVSAACCPCRA